MHEPETRYCLIHTTQNFCERGARGVRSEIVVARAVVLAEPAALLISDMSHRVLTLTRRAQLPPARLLKRLRLRSAQLDPIWEALSMSIVKVVGEIATFRLSCADEPALCAAFAVPPSTKPTPMLAGDAQNTLLPYPASGIVTRSRSGSPRRRAR